ncbi:MAG: hypothetical protein KDA71_17300 [Planctomycetales bacterium]|nr:hypothetical protein [Planctomycetales bacterium]
MVNRRAALLAGAVLPFTVAPGRAAASVQQPKNREPIPLAAIGEYFANAESKKLQPSDGIQVTAVPWKAGVTAAVVYGPRGILPRIARDICRNLALIDGAAWSDDRRAFTIFAEAEKDLVDRTIAAALTAPDDGPLTPPSD